MTGVEIISIIVSILVLLGGLEVRVRNLVKIYLKELKPNGGSSMKDQLNRLETQVDVLLQIMKK